MKLYKYSKIRLFSNSIGPVLLLSSFLLYSIYNQIKTRQGLNNIIILIILLVLYSDLIAINQPQKIADDNNVLSFSAFGRIHTYKWSDIRLVKVKTFPLSNKVLIRIDNYGFHKGIYWIDKKAMKNSMELINKLKELETKLI